MLIIDGANVVGSRPDGWWRDRAGAAGRLLDRLTAAVAEGRLPGPLTVVLEGAARAAPDPPDGSGVSVVRAPGSGDDAIVDLVSELSQAGRKVAVVTADRALRARVRELGAAVHGPSWLPGG